MNGLKFSYMKNKVILTSVFIFFLSFLNFQFNLFNVVSEFRFNYFQVESEQFVLDGFLNHSINDKPLQLGQFSRPSIDMFNDGEKYKPREWFINKFIEGEFWEYKSHFGLQLIIFNFFNGNLLLVQSLASFLLSLTVTILFIQLCKLHSYNFGLIFIASLVFNPWITPIARNSYFLVFIYLVPLVISYYFSRRINNSNFSLVIFLFILYTLFLFKSLIGYDYLSTIVITSMIPIVYYYLKNHLSVKKLITNLTSILLISFLSFSTSVVIHSDSLESEESPFEWIYYTAAKRLSSSSPEETARVACEKLMIDQAGKINVNDEAYQACYDEFLESLSVSRLNVLAKYMVARHFVPFFGSYEIELKEEQEKELKEIYYNTNKNTFEKGLQTLKYGFNNYNQFNFFQVASTLVNFIVSPILFIAFFILFFIKTFNSNTNNKIFNLFILLPPLSWFLIAKGHSYVTAYQLTFFIWFITTIPYMMGIVFSKKKII